MDAQGRGRADNIDPADHWVLNPNTGEYELRLGPSAPQSAVPRQAQSSTAPPGRRRGRTKPKNGKAKKILLWTGGSMAFVLVAASAVGYLYIEHLNHNITSVSDDGASTGGFRKNEAINILLIGTDKRIGKGNTGYGDAGSVGHADTDILLHISKDRSNATALSIPRDLIVDVPDCPTKQTDGAIKVIPGTQNVRFNTSLGQDGRTPSCTMRTVTELTGITPDDFMVADFNAVKTLTTAVGGVDVCLGKDINDPESHLKLSKGTHTIEGEQALAFVRTRYSVGFGGDLSRIQLQQQFLGSLMRKLRSNSTLSSPSKMLDLAEAATKAMTVDSKLDSIGRLKDLGLELGKLNTKNLSFTTVPVLDNPADGPVHKTVIVNTNQAPQVFRLIKDDVSFTGVKQRKKGENAAAAVRLKGSRSAAADIRVDIYNGGAAAGGAQEVLTWLQNDEGVPKSSQLGDASETLSRTTLEYSPDQADQARKLADIMGLPASAMKPGKSENNDQGLPAIVLTLGKDFKGAGVPLAPPTKAPSDIKKSTADKVQCAK